MIQQSYFCVYIPKGIESRVSKRYLYTHIYISWVYTPMAIVALFKIAKKWKQPTCPSVDEWINKCGVYLQKNIIQP